MFRELGFACPALPDDVGRGVRKGDACRYLFGFRLDVLESAMAVQRELLAQNPPRRRNLLIVMDDVVLLKWLFQL